MDSDGEGGSTTISLDSDETWGLESVSMHSGGLEVVLNTLRRGTSILGPFGGEATASFAPFSTGEGVMISSGGNIR